MTVRIEIDLAPREFTDLLRRQDRPMSTAEIADAMGVSFELAWAMLTGSLRNGHVARIGVAPEETWLASDRGGPSKLWRHGPRRDR
jgi:hypothetical protein